MKYTLFFVLVLSLIVASCGNAENKTKTPETVITKFNDMVSNATNIVWEQDVEENTWEVTFLLNDNKVSMAFTAEGTWLETEMAMDPTMLPDNLRWMMDTTYVGYSITELEAISTPEFNAYELEFKHQGKSMELLLGVDGNVLENSESEDIDEVGEKDED